MLCECIFCLLRRFAEFPFFLCSTALDVEPPFQCRRLNVSVVLGGDGRTAAEFDGGWRKLQSFAAARGGLAKNECTLFGKTVVESRRGARINRLMACPLSR